MMELVHMTATYSNAMLVALLPHFSDCAKQLDLPIPQPITAEQVARFNPSPYKNVIGCGLWLTNQFWFNFGNGFVRGFRCPDDWFTMADENWDHLERYVGQDNMTTNQAIDLARTAFRKLGYKPEDFHVDGLPTKVQGPHENKQLGHIPYARVEWNSPEPKSQAEFDRGYKIQFDIDMHRKRVVGMALMSKRFFRPDPEIDCVPELEADYRKRMRAAGQTNFVSPYAGAMFQFPPETHPPQENTTKLESPSSAGNHPKMFTRTNAPPHLLPNRPASPSPVNPLPGGQQKE